MRTLRALIVGKGGIGRELAKQLTALGWSVVFSEARDRMFDFVKEVENADIVFVCIPTRDKGEAAYQYITYALAAGKCVVTAEKGALAYHFESLRPRLPRIGFTATVGGGSEPLSMFSSLGAPRPKKINGFVNGTVNFLSWCLSQGMEPEEALAAAFEKGMPEKGATTFFQVFNAEIGDILMKLAVLVNVSGVCGKYSITPDCFSTFMLYEGEVLRLLSNPRLRFMVSMSEQRVGMQSSWQVYANVNGVHIVGAFLDPTEHYEGKIIPAQEQNSLFAEDYLGRSQEKWGPGAGFEPTAGVMVKDAKRLIAVHGIKE